VVSRRLSSYFFFPSPRQCSLFKSLRPSEGLLFFFSYAQIPFFFSWLVKKYLVLYPPLLPIFPTADQPFFLEAPFFANSLSAGDVCVFSNFCVYVPPSQSISFYSSFVLWISMWMNLEVVLHDCLCPLLLLASPGFAGRLFFLRECIVDGHLWSTFPQHFLRRKGGPLGFLEPPFARTLSGGGGDPVADSPLSLLFRARRS